MAYIYVFLRFSRHQTKHRNKYKWPNWPDTWSHVRLFSFWGTFCSSGSFRSLGTRILQPYHLLSRNDVRYNKSNRTFASCDITKAQAFFVLLKTFWINLHKFVCGWKCWREMVLGLCVSGILIMECYCYGIWRRSR